MTPSRGDLGVPHTQLPFLKEAHSPLAPVVLLKMFWSPYAHRCTYTHAHVHIHTHIKKHEHYSSLPKPCKLPWALLHRPLMSFLMPFAAIHVNSPPEPTGQQFPRSLQLGPHPQAPLRGFSPLLSTGRRCGHRCCSTQRARRTAAVLLSPSSRTQMSCVSELKLCLFFH